MPRSCSGAPQSQWVLTCEPHKLWQIRPTQVKRRVSYLSEESTPLVSDDLSRFLRDRVLRIMWLLVFWWLDSLLNNLHIAVRQIKVQTHLWARAGICARCLLLLLRWRILGLLISFVGPLCFRSRRLMLLMLLLGRVLRICLLCL